MADTCPFGHPERNETCGAECQPQTEPKDLRYLRVALGNDVASGWVTAKLKPADLELPFDQFCERYLRPAFDQAKREFDYQLECHLKGVKFIP